MNDNNLAWAAGFFDGEGCPTRRGNSPRIDIIQKEDVALRHWKDIFKVGAIYYYAYTTRSGKQTTRCAYVVNGTEAMQVLSLILPYLVLKRDKVLEIIKYGESKRSWRRKTVVNRQ